MVFFFMLHSEKKTSWVRWFFNQPIQNKTSPKDLGFEFPQKSGFTDKKSYHGNRIPTQTPFDRGSWVALGGRFCKDMGLHNDGGAGAKGRSRVVEDLSTLGNPPSFANPQGDVGSNPPENGDVYSSKS